MIHPVQQRIENDYIDSLLGSVGDEVESSDKTCQPDAKQHIEKKIIEPVTHEATVQEITQETTHRDAQKPVASGAVTSGEITAENITAENLTAEQVIDNKVIDDNLYQLILADNIKLAISLSEITQSLDSSAVTIQSNILFHNDDSYAIVNINELIGRPHENIDGTGKGKHFLLIQHRKLAIEYQQLIKVETIDEASVCWRTENSQREWLAGTAREVGVAILDLENIQQMLLK